MFARTILAISLTCALSSVTNAENNISSQSAANDSVPIESYPLSQSKTVQNNPTLPAVDEQTVAESPDDIDTSSEQDTPSTTNTIPATTDTTDRVAPNTTKNTTAKTTANLGTWSLDGINNAVWSTGMPIDGRHPVFAKLQVLLNDNHASPGPIDGAIGKAENLKGGKNNTLKAISAYQTMNDLPVTGILDQATWDSLNSKSNNQTFIEYTITEQDLKGPYATAIPSNYAEQAKMKGLYYTRVTEMLGEKFHMDEGFLKTLNPKAKFNKAGEKIIVANVRNNLPQDINLIVAHKGAKQLYLFNSKNKMIASFPATIGSTDTPSPKGTYTIKNIAPNPWYGYNPKNFVQGGNMKPLSLPPGPNNPVGNMWIGLSKPSFGIHGTPNPSTISKTASHGCIRLTNWDANDLAKRVKPGITVKFLE